MRIIRLVASYEFKNAVMRRSFWLTTLLFPVIILVLSLGNLFAGDLSGDNLEEALSPTAAVPLGYVDEAELISELPPGVPPAALAGFASTAQAEAALDGGEISGFVIIPSDYIATGRLTVVQDQREPLSSPTGGPLLEYVLANALTGEADIAAALAEPTPNIQTTSLQGSSETSDAARAGGPVAELVPFAVLFVLFFVITMSSSYLLQSVTREKENRTAELLLVSVRPRELMFGKVIGLAAVALLQITVWAGGGLLVLWRVADIPDLAGIGLSPDFLFWLIAFLAFGFLAYGSILAALGTLAPSQREGNQLMFIVLLPLMLPLLLNFALLNEPDGALAVALSLFPLSAPVAMMTRMAAVDVPLWQPAVALAGLALTAYLAVIIAARVFGAGNLLSSESFSWRRAWKTVLRSIGERTKADAK